MSLPIYELRIDEQNDAFVEAIALVEYPAIESNFLAFSSQKQHLAFSTDDEKQVLIGPAMIPNMKIYRRDDSKGEYEVYFSKETIEKIAQVFSKKGFQSNFNIEHNAKQSANSYVFQSMIVNEKMGIKPLDLPDGSWVIGVKVDSPEVWSQVKEGKFKGFSIEGVFELFKHEFTTNIKNEDAKYLELLDQAIKILQD